MLEKSKSIKLIQKIQNGQTFEVNQRFLISNMNNQIVNINKKQNNFKVQQTIQYKMENLQKKSDNLLLKVIAIQQEIQKYSENQYREMNYMRIDMNSSEQQEKQYQICPFGQLQQRHLKQLDHLSKIGYQKIQMIQKIQEDINSLKQQVRQNIEKPSNMIKQKKQLQRKFKKYQQQNKQINKSKSQRFQLLNDQIVSKNHFNRIQYLELQKKQNLYHFQKEKNSHKFQKKKSLHKFEQIQNKKQIQRSLNSQQVKQNKIEEIQKQFEQYKQRMQKKISIYEQELSQCFQKQQQLIRQIQKLKYEYLTQKILKASTKKNYNQVESQHLQNFKTELNIKFVQENKNQEELQNIKQTLKQLEQVNIKLKNDLTLKECLQLNKLKNKIKQQQDTNKKQKIQIVELKEKLKESYQQIQQMNIYIQECKQRIDYQQQIIEQTETQIQKNHSNCQKLQIQVKELTKKLFISKNKQKELKQLNDQIIKEKQLKKARLKLTYKIIKEFQTINSEKSFLNKTQQNVQMIPQLNLELKVNKPRTKMITTRHLPDRQNLQNKIDKFQTINQHNSVTLKKLINIKFSFKQLIETSNEQLNLKIKLALKLIRLALQILNNNQTKKTSNKQANRKFQSLRPEKLALIYKNDERLNEPHSLFQTLEDKLLMMNQNIQQIEFKIKQNMNDQIDTQKNLVYLSPEVLLGMNQFEFSYCWTIGIIIDELFHHKMYYNRIQQIVAHKNNYKFDLTVYQKSQNKQKIIEIKKVIEKMIVKNYKERLRLALVQQQLTKILNI